MFFLILQYLPIALTWGHSLPMRFGSAGSRDTFTAHFLDIQVCRTNPSNEGKVHVCSQMNSQEQLVFMLQFYVNTVSIDSCTIFSLLCSDQSAQEYSVDAGICACTAGHALCLCPSQMELDCLACTLLRLEDWQPANPLMAFATNGLCCSQPTFAPLHTWLQQCLFLTF